VNGQYGVASFEAAVYAFYIVLLYFQVALVDKSVKAKRPANVGTAASPEKK